MHGCPFCDTLGWAPRGAHSNVHTNAREPKRRESRVNVTAIVIGLALTVVVAVVVVVFTAYPSRGRKVPKAAWVNNAVDRITDRMPAEVAEEFRSTETSSRR